MVYSVDMIGDFQCSIFPDNSTLFENTYLGTELSFYTQDIITPNGKIQIIKNSDYQFYVKLIDSEDNVVYSLTFNTDANTIGKMYISLKYNDLNLGWMAVFAKKSNDPYAKYAKSGNSSDIYTWIINNKNGSRNFESVNEVSGIYGIMYDSNDLNSYDSNLVKCLWDKGIYQTNSSAADEYDYCETCYNVNTNFVWENKVHFLKSGSIIKTKTNDGLKIEFIDSNDEIIDSVSFTLPPDYTYSEYRYPVTTYYKREYYSGLFSMGFGIDDINEDGYVFVRTGFIYKLYKRNNNNDPYVYSNDGYIITKSVECKRSVRGKAIYDWIKANEIDSSGWKYVAAINDSKGNAVALSRVKDKYANGGRMMREWKKYYPDGGATQTRIIVEPNSELHYNINRFMNPS